MWVPIRDLQKEPTAAKTENQQITLQSRCEAVGRAQHDQDEVDIRNLISFTSLPMDPIILQEEHEFILQ